MTVINTNSYAAIALSQLKSAQTQQNQAVSSGAASTSTQTTAPQDTVTLSSNHSRDAETRDTYSQLAPCAKQNYNTNVQNIAGATETKKPDNRLEAAMLAILDKRTGVDREKLKEIDEEIAKIAGDNNLSEEEKAKQIELLQAKKEKLIREASEKNEERQRNNQSEVYFS
ncbi:hypothetical protein HRJ35_18435 [Shewanella oneidensis MR-1]|uniref:Uncharacterized protein n=1 Tax=Shewanella oneidensis (strain ATCC 700550 / JCM 31522 / CIP 106686 / LMG 19005 / NCIMB 14063 / MR-1) TaxID=211586 RepID=Q8EBV8_SHEON|nr:hypothetical protein [Shewanella oneidensis]AAN56385.1 uncharacterized protein SO_3387 [Shewanella oneidensis MR-1]MDX5999198.1 hypothetical protein [Shewanella oneidensis]MEE2028741.1 hypothetical protein [Shewanella oneidensis]QKG97787.1 hypothetical protein HRJ35_18435 [Shewanella oneidensis MR-1]